MGDNIHQLTSYKQSIHDLTSYKQFFSRFSSTVDPSDQLPVKVAGYNLSEFEIMGAVTDWCLQYLNQRHCPSSLIAPLIQRVVKEVHQTCSIDPKVYRTKENDFLPLQLMHLTMRKLVEVCCQYNDSTMLLTLPPPYSGLLTPKVSSCAIKNSRRSMEDRHVVLQDLHDLFNIKDCGSASYYAVFDGHNGLDAAVYGVSHLHQFLAESQYYPADPVLAFKDAFQKTDEQFIYKSEKENLRSGTTAVCALLRPEEHMLYIAWLGDSQAVIVRQGCPTQIVKPHKPDREDERERIEGMGGSVLFWGTWRVNGQLAVSRAIGDLDYKPYVSAEPDVQVIRLDGTEDFLILACDGLWDFVSEQEAVNAVYNQLNMSPDDLEGVSQRLVGLSKYQGSADNISVVVVFLVEPSEVARRRHMETASPNPFLKQNGSELFCGTPANGKLHPCTGSIHDEDDFGPETDVDMVDDVLLSPTIAVAKKLVAEKSEFEDDLERQRHQMSDFDDPADVDRSRDTPTPPAHEVVGNVDDNIAAESGEGEESEEEWNYFCGSTQNNKDTSVNTESLDSDMTSQLNPNAAEFVPVSPSRFMMDPDPVISSSPMHGHEKSLDNVPLPSQVEFNLDIAHRPGQLDSSEAESHLWSEGVAGNDDTRLVKSEQVSTNAEYGDDSILSFEASANNSTEQVLGKVLCDVTRNELDSFNNKSMEYNSSFGSQNIDSFKDLNSYSLNTEVKSFHKPTEVDCDLKVYCVPQEPNDSVVLETPKSIAVEAQVSPCDMQTDIDSQDDNQHNQKSPELISPSDGDGHLEGFSAQEHTNSSGFESESGADEPLTHISDDFKHSEGDGFTIEHRKSPPVQPVYFKPIHTFSDTNPFGVLDNLTSPNTDLSLTETNIDKLETDASSDSKTTDDSVHNKTDLLVDIVHEVPTYFQNPKENMFETHLHKNSLSTLPTEQHISNEKQEQILTSILDESQGIDESKQFEKIIPKDDDLLTTQSVFSSNTEHINPFGNSTCSFESKDADVVTSEFKESKVVAGLEQLEMEGEAKSKGNIFNTLTGLEFETPKQEFDDKVSDIIFGSRDTELAFDSGKSCEIESVIISSEHQVHNFEEIQFDTSKSNNKLESKYLDIHFGMDDIEFETDYNNYNLTNRSEENSVPCKEETENTVIDEGSKLIDNVVKSDNDTETEKLCASSNIEPVGYSVNNISSECSNIIKNVEIVEGSVDYKDSDIPSSKEHIETSVSSVVGELSNESEHSIRELCEDQIVNRKVTAVFDFDEDSRDLFDHVQDVQEKVEKEINESSEDRELGEEIHKDFKVAEAEKEISNTFLDVQQTEVYLDVKEVEGESIPVAQPEITQFPLDITDKVKAADKMEEPVSCKTETINFVNLNVIEDNSAFETTVNTRAELNQAIIPETEIITQTLRNEEITAGNEQLYEIVQNESFIHMDNQNEMKANEVAAEIPPSRDDTVGIEYNQNSEFCESAFTEMQELSKHTFVHVQSESQMQKSLHFEDTTSTINEVVIPTLNETCVIPKTELEFLQVSSDKVLKPVNETQPALQSDSIEQVSQTEETGQIPSVTETPPPTPAPGIAEEKEDRKEGLLAAAAAAAAAAGVATVAAAVVSDSKQTPKKLAATSKKPVTLASKKSSDVGIKAGAKSSLKTTGSPSKQVASKPLPQTGVTKKPSTSASKTTKAAAPEGKTTVLPTAPKCTTPKPSTPISKTATTASKPSTPYNKPATPTSRPASANRTDISKSPLNKPTHPTKAAAAKLSKPATNTIKVTEKKTITNGEVLKPAAKKTEQSETKKVPLSATGKPVTTVGRPASVVAAKSPVTKVSPITKTAVACKTSPIAPTVQSKPKPAVSNPVKQSTKPNTSTSVVKSRPLSVSAILKPTDKTGKDTVNKQISSVKTSTISKVSPGNKTILKTESKVSNKVDSSKLKSKDQVKKSVGTKSQEPTQEHTVTTTNGYTDITEIGIKKEPSVDDSNHEAVKVLE